MNYSHLEINFRRLLQKTELIAEKQEPNNWRLEKYISSLEDILKELNKATVNKPSVDTLKDYAKRVDFLKKISKLNEPISDKSTNELKEETALNKAIPNPGPIISKRDIKPKQIYQKSKQNQENLLREQLLGSTKKQLDNGDNSNSSSDMNKLLAEHQENQEKIANEMIKSVRAIKENSLLASKIIKSDNKLLDDINTSADKNSENLKTVNDHLSERVSRSCNCWIWIMLFLVMMVFIMMVLFMKIFPKKNYVYVTPTTSATTISPSISKDMYTHYLNNKTLVIDNQTIHKIEL